MDPFQKPKKTDKVDVNYLNLLQQNESANILGVGGDLSHHFRPALRKALAILSISD